MDLDPPWVCGGSSDSGPTPTCGVPTESTAAKARPSSATEILTIRSDVPQERTLHSWQQGPCGREERLQLAFTALFLELMCGFSPTSACAPPTGLWSQRRPRAWPGWSPSGALGRQGQHVCPAVCASAALLHVCGCAVFLCEHAGSWLPHSRPHSSFPAAYSCSLRRSLSKPRSASPRLHQQTVSEAGACRAVAQTICASLTLSCLPQPGCCTLLQAPKRPSVPAHLPTSGRASQMWEPLLPSVPHPGMQASSLP